MHGLQCILYYLKEIEWTLFDNIFPDLYEHIPIVGPVIHHSCVAFAVNVVVDKIYL